MIAWLKRVAAENALATARVEEEAERQRLWTAAGFAGRCPPPFPPARPPGFKNPPMPKTPAGGQRSGREAHNLTAEGSTPSPATIPTVGGYQPSTFDESPGVPPQGGTGTVRPQVVHGWERVCEITRDDAAPLRRHIALSRNFDLAVHNILDYAETRLLEGEDVQLDRVAELIAAKVRENLQLVYRPAAEGR